jgi:hypothetical protein
LQKEKEQLELSNKQQEDSEKFAKASQVEKENEELARKLSEGSSKIVELEGCLSEFT